MAKYSERGQGKAWCIQVKKMMVELESKKHREKKVRKDPENRHGCLLSLRRK